VPEGPPREEERTFLNPFTNKPQTRIVETFAGGNVVLAGLSEPPFPYVTIPYDDYGEPDLDALVWLFSCIESIPEKPHEAFEAVLGLADTMLPLRLWGGIGREVRVVTAEMTDRLVRLTNEHWLTIGAAVFPDETLPPEALQEFEVFGRDLCALARAATNAQERLWVFCLYSESRLDWLPLASP
jgi:hypothetical protein